jgi:hypothetical protein
MDSLTRKMFLGWLAYDLSCVDKPEFAYADEFWGIWMPPEIKMRKND